MVNCESLTVDQRERFFFPSFLLAGKKIFSREDGKKRTKATKAEEKSPKFLPVFPAKSFAGKTGRREAKRGCAPFSTLQN